MGTATATTSDRTDALSSLTSAVRLLATPVSVPLENPLRTARLCLRQLRRTDRRAFTALVAGSRDHLGRFCPLHHSGETDDALFERQLAMGEQGDRSGRAWRRVIQRSDGRLIGAVNINTIRHGLERGAEINWWLGEAHTGQGLAREAVEAASSYALSERGLGLDCLRAYIAPSNAASAALASGAGYAPSMEWRTVGLTIDGSVVWHDVHVRYATVVGASAVPTASAQLRAGILAILEADRGAVPEAS